MTKTLFLHHFTSILFFCLFILQIAIIMISFAIFVGTIAQDYSQLFAGFGPYFRAAAPMRDPRSNTGKQHTLICSTHPLN